MIFRWADRPRGNVHVDERLSVEWLLWLLVAVCWLSVVAYGMVLVLFVS